ncbi:MAG: hypothetical protein ACLFWF_04220 [Alphaproteobacteria bacterium]
MKRALILAAAALCVTAAAHAQGVSKKYDWDDANKQSCMEPYAPAVPGPEETSLKELLEEVKPEIESFIEDSNRYLKCLSVQMAKAREDRDQETMKELVKAHNENVEYQQSVAGEYNATLKSLKEEAGLAVAGESGEDKDGAEGAGGSETGDAESGDGEGSADSILDKPVEEKEPSEG